jgi:hypothetical protein
MPRPLTLITSHFFQLSTCGHSSYITSSLKRAWVCRLQLLLVLASALILRSESRETHHILFYQIRDSPNLEGQVPVFISPLNRVAQLYPRHWDPFSSPPTTRRATVEVFDPASTWDWNLVESHVYCGCGPVARQRQRKKQLYNSHYWVTSISARQQLEIATEERCFLCSPCRDVISKTVTVNFESTVGAISWLTSDWVSQWISQSWWGSVSVSCCWEKLVARARDSSGTQRKGKVRRWKPLLSNV